MKVTVVIPCFNEQEVLPELYKRINSAAQAWPCAWNVICVDDGSRDQTWEMLVSQAERDERWHALSLARNYGHQTAVSAGIHHADGDAIIVIDADLQDPPEELGRFIEKWQEGFEVVYAIREKRKEGPLKKFCYWIFYRLLAHVTPFEIPLDSGDFCLMDRKVVDVLKSMPERNRFVRGLRAWAGFRQTGLTYERHARAAGEAKYNFRKLFKLALDGIFSFSTMPLTLVAHTGVWISIISFIGMIWILATKVFSTFFQQLGFPPVRGFTTIMICILFLGGIQLLSLGVIGEYIGRIYEEVKRRPQWVIKQSAGITPKTTPT